jgi:hypothetical protein
LNNIYRQCKPFLKEWFANYPKHVKIWYSGRYTESDFFIKNVRTDRRPMNTGNIAHYNLDNYFKEKFGFKARSNVIFVTGYMNEASMYGTPYMIFPIDTYRYIWSNKIDDLYDYSQYFNKVDKNGNPMFDKKAKSLLNTYSSTNLKQAIESRKEIMLNCKKYIGVRAFVYGDIIHNWFDKYRNKKPTMENITMNWDEITKPIGIY